MDQYDNEYYTRKAARMRLLGEDVTYPLEYAIWLERIEAYRRKQARREEARRLSSSTKSPASNS